MSEPTNASLNLGEVMIEPQLYVRKSKVSMGSSPVISYLSLSNITTSFVFKAWSGFKAIFRFQLASHEHRRRLRIDEYGGFQQCTQIYCPTRRCTIATLDNRR